MKSYIASLMDAAGSVRDPTRSFVAIYRAYYDASGSEGADAPLTVAGLVATEAKWLAFERLWREVLEQYDVPYFHAKEFVGSRGPFSEWAGDEERRAAFLARLVKVIKLGANKMFTVAAHTADFAAVNERFHLLDSCGPYALCAGVCVRRAHDWIMTKGPERVPIHVIESGDAGQGKLTEILGNENLPFSVLPKVDPISGEWVLEFQAADLLAWEFRRGYKDITLAGRMGDSLRRSLREVVMTIPGDQYEVEGGKLRQMCLGNPGEFPPRVFSSTSN